MEWWISWKGLHMPRCPSCNTLMTRVEKEGVRIATCSGCYGDWLQRLALLRLVREPMEVKESDPSLQELAAVVVESNTQKTLSCQECHQGMRKERLHHMVPVQIDRCYKCDAVWLDVGKLSLLRRLYQELQVSTDPAVIALREKLAGANLAMEQYREEQAEAMARYRKMGRRGSLLGEALGFLADRLGG